jgi:hypothetical protein
MTPDIPAHRSDHPHRSEEDQRAFFDEVLAQAKAAEAQAGAIERDIMLLGRRIRLVFAGRTLEPLLFPALSHRQVPVEGTADLVLHLWDSDSSGVAMPAAPVTRHCFSDRGDIWTFHSARVRSAFQFSEYSVSLLDLGCGEGIYWLRGATGLPYWTQASPLRTLLHWWTESLGAQLVHAAAVGTRDGGVLITGRGGVGKSTTALACLAAGFDYAGDDYVLLTAGDEVHAHSIYRTAKLNPDNAARFAAFGPRMLGSPGADGSEKAVVFLEGGLVESIPLRAVVTPRFGDGAETFIEPIESAQLVGAASFTTMAQLPHAGQRTADFIEAQIARLPGGRLVLGSDAGQLVETIRTLIATPTDVVSARPASTAPTPLISVVVPVHNGAHFVADAVGSILAQGHPKVEIILVDDGSTDAIEEAVAALPVEVRFLRKAKTGAAAARNTGLRATMGELITFLDVDDLWPPGKFSAALAWLEDNPECDVVIGNAQLLQLNDAGGYDYVGSPNEGFFHYLGGGLWRRRAFERIGDFDPLLKFAEDVDWFVRAEQNGLRVDRLEMVALHVRRHDTNATRGLDGRELNPLKLVRNALEAKRALGQ